MKNTITIELCPEDRGRLDALITELRVSSDTLELIRLALTNAGTPFPAAPVQPQTEPKLAAEAEPTPEPEKPAEAQEPVQDVLQMRASLQKKIVELTTAGKKAAVKEIVQAYATKVSAIPEDKLAEVLSKLTELEG